jgi:hypothetical protein
LKRYIIGNAKEIQIKDIASEHGMNERAVLKIFKSKKMKNVFYIYKEL